MGKSQRGTSFIITQLFLTYCVPYDRMLDRVEQFLDPQSGLIGCVDFYVSGRSSQTQTVANAGDIKRLCNWWNRMFWLHWFEWDHVDLHPSRRNCKCLICSLRRDAWLTRLRSIDLEWRFGTVKSINCELCCTKTWTEY